MARAFEDLYGVSDVFTRIEFSGRSDTAIFLDAAREHGLDDPKTELPRFLDAYIPEIRAALKETKGKLMLGVVEALDALGSRPDVVQGLGTGNFRSAAEAKLRHYAIDEYFPGYVGGFGDDHEERAELIRVGINRLHKEDEPTRVVVIGDTPHDVLAAHANGAVAIGVATGRDTVVALLQAGADYAMRDLSETERLLTAILDHT